MRIIIDIIIGLVAGGVGGAVGYWIGNFKAWKDALDLTKKS